MSRVKETDCGHARLTIVDPGLSTTIQDGGRHGSIHHGVSPSGAVDRRALRAANGALGIHADAPALESVLGRMSFRLSEDRWCAVAGARSSVHVDGKPCSTPSRFLATAGSLVTIGEATRGLYTILAVAGGVSVPLVLGSASTDTLSGIGPRALRAGDEIAVGGVDCDFNALADESRNVPLPPNRVEIPFFWGPRDDMFTASDRQLFLSTEWTVTTETSRVGARLDGARLQNGSGTLPSEGVMQGSIQVPPSGQPIVFLADRPVTGGYPVLGIIDEAELGLFAQVRPGSAVRFRPIAVELEEEDG